MRIILIPGLWLNGETWEAVTPLLEAAGHTCVPITFPGMESKDADRSEVTVADMIGTILAAIDSAEEQVVLVGHSLGAGLASAALDARVDKVARAIYIGGFPAGDGDVMADGFTIDGGDLPMPDPAEFDEADIRDMDEQAMEDFKRRAVPSPSALAKEAVSLTNDRRYEIPVTVICPEFTAGMLQEWIDQDMAPVREFTKIKDLTYVDVPTGHWPQFTRPTNLAKAILEAVGTN